LNNDVPPTDLAPESPSTTDPTTCKNFTDALDREGYNFQHTVLRQIGNLPTRGGQVAFEVSEFPTLTRGKGSRVDFILRVRTEWTPGFPVLLICECKRSNPALSKWCFARAPYVHSGWIGDGRVIAERIRFDKSAGRAVVETTAYRSPRIPYHIGLPVKTGQLGHP
jgi:hypothetical protein